MVDNSPLRSDESGHCNATATTMFSIIRGMPLSGELLADYIRHNYLFPVFYLEQTIRRKEAWGSAGVCWSEQRNLVFLSSRWDLCLCFHVRYQRFFCLWPLLKTAFRLNEKKEVMWRRREEAWLISAMIRSNPWKIKKQNL